MEYRVIKHDPDEMTGKDLKTFLFEHLNLFKCSSRMSLW